MTLVSGPAGCYPVYYFAYGSNMATARLRAPNRAPSARKVGVATLPEYALRFHKRSKDGSGKCDACLTREPTDLVFGVVFDIAPEDKERLDRAEGVGSGYEEREVSVELDGESCKAFLYVAQRKCTDPGLAPYDWYRDWVLMGAREHHLPDDYIRAIEKIQTYPDPDGAQARREREAQRKCHAV